MVLTIVMAAGVLMAQPWRQSAAFSLMLKMPVGLTVAALVAWMMAADWCVKGIEYLRRRTSS
jgi:hypothetical protein